ncbi:MAG: DUF805 domain-containing protein [Clostridia bacterium]|nr:DUF805 domain-containing protein [Clostridia bacterium]
MIKSFSKYWQNFAEFAPRTRRRDFWLAFLANLIITGILCAAYFFVPIFKYVLVAYSIVCLCPNLAITVRRLHDTGISGKFLFMLLIPVVGLIIVLVKLTKNSDEEENAYGISEKYSPAQPEAENEKITQDMPPMYIPPIYNTDKAEQPPVELAVKAEAPSSADAVRAPQPVEDIQPVQPVQPHIDRFTVEQPHEAENEFTVRVPQPVIQPQENIDKPVSEPEKSVGSTADSQPYNASRPVYSDKPSEKPAEEKPKQERPKGYRSRSFPYGH